MEERNEGGRGIFGRAGLGLNEWMEMGMGMEMEMVWLSSDLLSGLGDIVTASAQL